MEKWIGAALLIAATPLHAQAANDAPFKQRCAVCHDATAGGAARIGPNLYGIVGRKAGAAAYPYSPAMKSSAIVWTPEKLDRFLTAPGKLVPGTKMPIAVPGAADRQAIIAYLKTLRK
ncbi:c-type cytochrome [Sphingomonas sp. MMSM20]|uniref:c-type cytochrome n=1 Tax=Sphingomonas lycopersici TaxID=2951807 RepID=UPI002238B221|nr:c-type cytochrome [Sphingomonas lycopersici]MCW6528720.1 c-type cytochrome [Sphingomonas lycopersici]